MSVLSSFDTGSHRAFCGCAGLIMKNCIGICKTKPKVRDVDSHTESRTNLKGSSMRETELENIQNKCYHL